MINTLVLVIDVQNDFCEGGALAVLDSETLISPLNEYLYSAEAQGMLIGFSKDWHPAEHMSFQNQGGEWPTHCVAGTHGAQLHKGLYLPSVYLTVHKGNKVDVAGYSAFDHTNLARVLHQLNITEVILCGIAASYCVLQTALSSVDLGFKTSVIRTLTRDIYPIEEQEQLWEKLQRHNVVLID